MERYANILLKHYEKIINDLCEQYLKMKEITNENDENNDNDK